MDAIRNPFAPGAGSQPPELSGREEIISRADIAIQRSLLGRSSRSQILLGLRGTGKTVLLNKIGTMGESHGMIVSTIEAPEDQSLPELLVPRITQAIRKFSLVENAKEHAHKAMGALRSFMAAFKLDIGEVSISIDPLVGTADSGNLEYDLPELFLSVGYAAKAAGKGWLLLIDELQYLSSKDLSALIVAIHRSNQTQLPLLMVGAGLPQIAALAGEAKSYAERLFDYVEVGALPEEAARAAIFEPIVDENEAIDDKALEEIYKQTGGYPYFIQEWGYQSWNEAESSPIGIDTVKQASIVAINRLDEGFFRVRLDRLTPKEKKYVMAMATLGVGPYRSSDVADQLGETSQSLGPVRAKIIHKGMIYSPSHGDVAFTVPLYEEYLRRIGPIE